MTNEIKSGGKVVATITQRQAIAFQLHISGAEEPIYVPAWANTVAIDEDGAIWAYESVAEDVLIIGVNKAWVDCGRCDAKMQEIGEMEPFADWKESQIDLRTMQ
ncbi:hypothetical protein [Klebsiella phage vB_KpnS_ZX2]|uniref:Uncharacterized protein n=1 Tax=Klebsiella phage vB_KpnS_ZX2 TaxID=2820397 RepID=A0A8A6C9F8_9CAUD|nr:hypothetical protein [Klebsiella phage vB_KpnS_ZX2]